MEATDADLNDEDEVDNRQLCFGLHTSQRGSVGGLFSGCTDNSDMPVCQLMSTSWSCHRLISISGLNLVESRYRGI